MRLIEDHHVGCGDQGCVPDLFEGEIREREMVIDDQDVCGDRSAASVDDETPAAGAPDA